MLTIQLEFKPYQKKNNIRYYDLIKKFKEKTGCL